MMQTLQMKHVMYVIKSTLSLVLLAPWLAVAEDGRSAGSTAIASVSTRVSLPRAQGFLPKDGGHLFAIGCYGLPKADAELARMAQAGINLVRCQSSADLDRVASVGMLGWVPVPMQSGNSEPLREKIESLMKHPALAIWEGPDEIVHNFTVWSGLYRTKGIYKSPDEWRQQTSRAIAYSEEQAQQIIPNLRAAAQLIRTLDPNKRQIWINEAAQSDLKFVRQYIDHIDITGCE